MTEETTTPAATEETTTATANQTTTETTNKTPETPPTPLDFGNIADEIKAASAPKQNFAEAENPTEKKPEPKAEEPEEKTTPEGEPKEPTATEQNDLLQSGAEMIVNITDYALSHFNAWLNKDIQNVEDFEAPTKGKGMIEKNLIKYFQDLGIKFTPKQGIFYSIVVVYGMDFLSGIYLRTMDFFKWLFKPATYKPNVGASKLKPEEKETAKEQTPAEKREEKERTMRKQGLKPCENPACNKDEGFNQWHKNKEFCCKSCAAVVANAKRKEV